MCPSGEEEKEGFGDIGLFRNAEKRGGVGTLWVVWWGLIGGVVE
jgi:hypothetical protein